MSQRYRQLASVLIAALFLMGSIPVGMTDVASAENTTVSTSEDERKCSEVGIFAFLSSECQSHYGDGSVQTVNGKETVVYDGVDTEGRTAEQVHWGVFSDGTFMADSTDQFYTEAKSRTNQTHALAYADAKVAALEVRNNGGSKAEAQQAAIQAINEFYSEPQKSFFTQQNRQALRLSVMNQTVVHTGGLPYRDVFVNVDGDSGAQLYVEQGNVTLWDGEEMTVHRAYGYRVNTNSGYSGDRYTATYYDGGHRDSVGQFEDYDGEYFLNQVSPTGETIMLMDAREANKTLQHINDRRLQAIDNVGPIVDGIWASCDVGECDVSDVLTSTELIHKMSTNYDTTGSYAPAAAILADMNYATNATAAFNVTWDNTGPNGTISGGPAEKTATGQLFIDEAAFPNGIQSGQQYNASERNGSIIFIYQDGSRAKEVVINGTLTVNRMWDPLTDETINQTKVQDTDFATTDTTDINKQIAEILENQQELENRLDSQSGTVSVMFPGVSDFFEGIGFDPQVFILLLAGGLVLVGLAVLTRF